MTSHLPEPVLFEAITTPSPGLSGPGARLVAGGIIGALTAIGVLFASLGAWPVIGFVGAEAALVLALFALHRRTTRRAVEILRVVDGRVTVSRTDWRGRQESFSLDAYWTRPVMQERPGRVSALLLRHRETNIEVGLLLGEEQKRDMAQALAEALRRYREPVFDNPQLRVP